MWNFKVLLEEWGGVTDSNIVTQFTRENGSLLKVEDIP